MNMETLSNTTPGYRVYEYLLALAPHEELAQRITQIRQGFAEKYKTEEAGRGRPWVPLVRFTQYAMMEERIIHRLQSVATGFSPFKVELKDYGSFPSHTIYIAVTSKLPVQQLVKTIRSNTQRLMKMSEEQKPHFILEPHINIARKLKPWQYEKGWLEFSHRQFSGRFIADSMYLLRRPEGEGKFQSMLQFSFQDQQVVIRQGDLFG
jgi:2'-5' RNA ligase